MSLLNCATDAAAPDPLAFARRLADCVQASAQPVGDDYGQGGAVAAFEAAMATALGKQRAILFPTGTLANMVALRAHAAARRGRRILMQAESHIAHDCGDGAAELAGLALRLVPDSDFGTAALARELDLAAGARVASPLAAVSVEAPLRRGLGRVMPLVRQQALCMAAREAGVASHLDGARLYIAAGFTGLPVMAYAAGYDTVYVSLYKYFGVPFGAVLAGSDAFIAPLFHERRRFGGGLYQMWPVALMALDRLPGLAAEWQAVAGRAAAVLPLLEKAGLVLHPVAEGSNVLPVSGWQAAGLENRAAAGGVRLPPVRGGFLDLRANASWLTEEPQALAARLTAVLLG